MVKNPIDRYLINSTTPGLVRGEDGSLTMYIQHDRPEDEDAAADWLPAPADPFCLVLRNHMPAGEDWTGLGYRLRSRSRGDRAIRKSRTNASGCASRSALRRPNGFADAGRSCYSAAFEVISGTERQAEMKGTMYTFSGLEQAAVITA